MLSWSSQQDGTPADLDALASGDGDAGLPHGALLMAFAEAAAGVDDAALAEAREALVDATSEAFMIDAAAVVANFEMMTRVADGTGALHAAEREANATALATRLGMVERP
ncbi:MAG: hypothetical protein HY828_06485 [Actinobacteria bacterium]|nr:hypothetical protein [Actinomycetota bacterium]